MLPASFPKDPKLNYFSMVGRAVFEFATTRGSEVIVEILARTNTAKEDIGHVILHQANINIIDEIARRTNLPREKFFVNLDRIGNTAGASVLIALAEMIESKLARPGELVLLVAFGGGLTWGATLIRL
jgi:3-oxoacyl-[acyl-carrier-protein] synthase-3